MEGKRLEAHMAWLTASARARRDVQAQFPDLAEDFHGNIPSSGKWLPPDDVQREMDEARAEVERNWTES